MTGAQAARPPEPPDRPANENGRSANPTVVDLPPGIPDEQASRLAKVLARILVGRALVATGIRPANDQ